MNKNADGKRQYLELTIRYRIQVEDSNIETALDKLREDGHAFLVKARIRRLDDEQVFDPNA